MHFPKCGVFSSAAGSYSSPNMGSPPKTGREPMANLPDALLETNWRGLPSKSTDSGADRNCRLFRHAPQDWLSSRAKAADPICTNAALSHEYRASRVHCGLLHFRSNLTTTTASNTINRAPTIVQTMIPPPIPIIWSIMRTYSRTFLRPDPALDVQTDRPVPAPDVPDFGSIERAS